MKKPRSIMMLLLAGAFALSSCGSSDKSEDDSSIIDEVSSITTEEPLSEDSQELPSEPLSEDSSEDGDQPKVEGEFGVTPDVINVSYYRDDGDYSTWRLWWWIEGFKDGEMPEWGTPDADGFVTQKLDLTNYPSAREVGLIIRRHDSWSGQSPDFVMSFDDYPTKDNGEMDVFIISNDQNEIESFLIKEDAKKDRIKTAQLKTFNSIGAEATATPLWWRLYINDELVDEKPASSPNVTFERSTKLQLTDVHEVRAEFSDAPGQIRVRKANATPLYDSEEFINNHTYNGDDLGFTYTNGATTFKLWAPTASEVILNTYRNSVTSKETGNKLNDTLGRTRYMMNYAGQGVYERTIEGDLDGVYYDYTVTNVNGTTTVGDPYAQSAGVNGHRSQVINWDNPAYKPAGFDEISYPAIASSADLVVYEMHVQDLTMDDTWTGSEENRGKYLGVIEEGTTYTEGAMTVATGFDHIKEMGVNAVQIMPFYDHTNQEYFNARDYPDADGKYYQPEYNWGYNPNNFNVLEGGYSSDPVNGEVRIQEFRQLVKKFADNNIRIVMDVVYNHVSSFANSPFQKIVPDYYFRFNEEGFLMNDSGVGNDTASERIMFENYIVDSVKFWAKKYHIKGFRFDLMSLITPKTLNRVDAALKAIDPTIVVWGEPWSGGGYAGPEFVYNRPETKNTAIAAFNDVGRNALKGDNNLNGDGSQYGWLQKEPAHNAESYWLLNRVKGMLAGYMEDYYDGQNGYRDPLKTINYAGCHDNFTLYDQLYNTIGEHELAKNASVVANALVLFSQGAPFFQGGDEILRSKPFDPNTYFGKRFYSSHAHETFINPQTGVYYSGNSYNLEASVNSYKWDDKIKYYDVFEQYKALIQLRLNNEAFRLQTAGEVSTHFGFWEDTADLSFSAIAAYNTKQVTNEITASGAIYTFYTGRLYGGSTIGTSAATTEKISWGGDVKVLFDSTGTYTPGDIITDSAEIPSYAVLVVQRQ